MMTGYDILEVFKTWIDMHKACENGLTIRKPTAADANRRYQFNKKHPLHKETVKMAQKLQTGGQLKDSHYYQTPVWDEEMLFNANRYLNIEHPAGSGCLQRARRGFDKLYFGSNVPDTDKAWENMGISSIPRKTWDKMSQYDKQYYIKKYPYFQANGSASLDSGDIAGWVAKTQKGRILYSSKEDVIPHVEYKGKLTDETKKNILSKITVGSIINYSHSGGRTAGVYNKHPEHNLPGAIHSAIVTGFLEDGTPIIYDLNSFYKMNMSDFSSPSVAGRSLATISTPAIYQNLTFENVKNQYSLNDRKLPFKNKIQNLINNLYPVSNPIARKNINDAVSGLENYKSRIMKALNISSDEYDKYAKLTLAVGAQESKYWLGAKTYPDNWWGDTNGFFQMNPKNFENDIALREIARRAGITETDNFKSRMLVSKDNAGKQAALTLLYIYNLSKQVRKNYDHSAQQNYQIMKYSKPGTAHVIDGKTGQYGHNYFTTDEGEKIELNYASSVIPEKIAAASKDGYVNKAYSVLSSTLNSPLIPKFNPLRYIPERSVSSINADLRKAGEKYGKPDKYYMDEQRKIYKQTEGNIPLDANDGFNGLLMPLIYSYQNPRSIRLGDMQGKSLYYNNVLKYMNLLN
jgi:hypothetical protein